LLSIPQRPAHNIGTDKLTAVGRSNEIDDAQLLLAANAPVAFRVQPEALGGASLSVSVRLRPVHLAHEAIQ